MDFISNKTPQIEEMSAAIGIKKIEELFTAIPAALKIDPPLWDDGLSEYEGRCLMENLAAKNSFPSFENYLGGGAYEHYVPALIGSICSQSGFLTSYTPYQAEASQGTLQAIFEFQTAICALTGMDVSNGSVYDGASACAEALLMALRLQKGRKKILIAASLHPHYRDVVKQYLRAHPVDIEWIPFGADFRSDLSFIEKNLDEQTVAILIQSPNFTGVLESVQEIAAKAKEVGALTILCANPLSFGIYASPSELGVDIAVGDTQPFGISLQFGGPYVGYMACKKEFVRQLPGRIVGETIDTKGRRGFVLTLQAREQHIRREKATSNICTNQALSALASLIAILWYGKEGIPALAMANFRKASYLRIELSKLDHVTVDLQTPIFNEFVVDFHRPASEVQAHFRENGIEAGLALEPYYPELSGHLLICVTEVKSLEQLDRYIAVAKKMSEK